MNKRINVILPTTTVAVLDKVATKGNRSALIDCAIRHYIKTGRRQNLRERLKQEALANAERDLQIAAEWFPFGRRSMATRPRPEKEKVAFPRRGEIYLVHFDPTVGHEIQKTRPAVIIQNDVSNRYSPITIVAVISAQFSDPPFPREVVIEPEQSGLPRRSAVMVNQIRFVDRRRLAKKLGQLSGQSLRRVDEALRISLSLVEL